MIIDDALKSKLIVFASKFITDVWSEEKKKEFLGMLENQETDEDVSKFLDMWARVIPKADIMKFLKDNSHVILNDLPEIAQPEEGRLITQFALPLALILKDKSILFYRTNTRSIVEVGKIKLQKDEEENYSGFVEVKPSRFITLIENYVVPGFYRYDGKTKDYTFKRKSINSDLANTLLCSDILHKTLPPIERIYTIPMPIIYEGKLTFPKKGYDERFHSWLPYDAPEISRLDMPLEEAKQIIHNIFKDFCFQSTQDYANAVAAFLTPDLRGLYKTPTARTPISGYLANRERAGKDYCAGCTGILYEGFALEESPVSSSDGMHQNNNTEELRKKILSAMIMGRKRLHFSNNKGFINNSVLEAVATAEKWSDRILGKNEILTFDNEMDFSLSGNVGVTFTPDFANRSRFIRFFLDIEDANSRTFELPDLHGWIKENRPLILSALYALIRNWIEKGKPKSSVPFTSFHEWSDVCGGIMECAGYDNPCNRDSESLVVGGDYETTEMKKLFEYCYERVPERRIKKTEIKNLIQQYDDLDIFSAFDFTKKPDVTRFGLILTKFGGRVLSGIRMKIFDNSVRTSRQELIFTKNLNGKSGHLGDITPSVTSDRTHVNIDSTVGKVVHMLPSIPKNEQKVEEEHISAEPIWNSNNSLPEPETDETLDNYFEDYDYEMDSRNPDEESLV
jgi:hypothetical protein